MPSLDPVKARALYDDGHGRNAIAKQLGVGVATVTRWAQAQGLLFDRSQTELAVRAHVIDLRANALLLAQKQVVAANDMLDRLDGHYVVAELGRGPEGEGDRWIEHVWDEPPVEVVRNAVVTAGIAIDKALKVEAALNDGGESETKSMLQRLAEQFGIKAGQ